MNLRSLFACSVLAPLCATRFALAQEPPAAIPAAIPAEVQPITAAAPAEQTPASVPEPPVAAEPQSIELRTAPAAVQPLGSPLHTVSRWYGWQTLMADGAWLMVSVAAVGAGEATGGPSEALGWLAIGGYFLGGPIVHFGHGNVGKGLGSLALRSGLPIVAGAIGAKASASGCGGSGEWCGVGGALIGGLAGMVGAIVLDATVLGYEKVQVRNSTWPIVGVSSDGERTLVTAQGRF